MNPKMRFYNKIPNQCRNIILNNFTLLDGELRQAIKEDRVIKLVVAKNKHNRIVGWCAVYKSIYEFAPIYCKGYSLGIFVNEKYRHRGIGSALRRKASLWCLGQNKKAWFFNDGWKPTLITKEGMKRIDDLPIKSVNLTLTQPEIMWY